MIGMSLNYDLCNTHTAIPRNTSPNGKWILYLIFLLEMKLLSQLDPQKIKTPKIGLEKNDEP